MSLYLKYRPQDFTSLVGQKFIKQTLKKAVSEDKTVGAYIFTGPRGTGKTSTARIFAKAINCLNPDQWNPCLTCDICSSFAQDKLIDIIEIDAASHTGVDNIREIIEKAQFQPTKTRFKVYIIDEVHMLSKWAFNALLKILEEPPKHVKFILATTEIHKVPETILSRCQRYDFRNHTPEDVRERLLYIAWEEKVTIDEDSLDYIVQSSHGGLRNAISLFEQLIFEDKIEYSMIQETLGISSDEVKTKFVQKLIEKDISILSDYHEIVSSWKNIKLFFHDIIITLSEISKQDLLAGKDITSILLVLETLHDTYGKSKNSFDEVLTFEIGIMKIISWFSTTNTKEAFPIKKEPTLQSSPKKSSSLIPEEKTPDLVQEAENIFSLDEPDFDTQEPKSVSTSVISSHQTGEWFDVESLITEAKKLWAKAAVTMSLRGSECKFSDTTLIITTKTKIAKNTLSTAEASDVINGAISALWKEGFSYTVM